MMLHAFASIKCLQKPILGLTWTVAWSKVQVTVHMSRVQVTIQSVVTVVGNSGDLY